jgi:single-strand DNA-binding protein
MSLNKVMLIGNTGKDPEVTTLQGGNKVAKFTVATTESYKDKSGTKVEKTEWHNVVVWGPLADIAEKYLKKGRQVYVEGKVQTRSWDDSDGKKRYATEINATSFELLGNRPAGEGSAQSSNETANTSAPAASATANNSKTSTPAPAFQDADDDLPF